MPTGNSMHTPWVPATPIPLPEYPRPQLVRPLWTNLNGWWEYAILPKDEPIPETYQGQILVPYPVESLLSGVQKALRPDQNLWYQRCFTHLEQKGGGRTLLHFGAVDYECHVWVNGILAGNHRGGYLPFTFDITDFLRDGENQLTVSTWDPTDTGFQQRGKQTLHPNGIWYTAVSGIWQTVWIEDVPAVSIDSIKLTPDLDARSLIVEVRLRGAGAELHLSAQVIYNNEVIASQTGISSGPIFLTIPDPQPWSPADPTLYDLRLRLVQENQVIDEVTSYFAMRKFSLQTDDIGYMRFALNNQPVFLYGPLDQGYFPDGLYTPASEQAMLYDLEYTCKIGCNLIRKHVKVEPLRWYYLCDRLGIIVWQDMPSGGGNAGDADAVASLIFSSRRDDTRHREIQGRGDEANREEFHSELRGMVDLLFNTACIAAWVPFNEGWGQFDANEIARWTKSYDPTRLVDHASGWYDQHAGDFLSKHVYMKKARAPKSEKRIFALSEFGGYSLKVPMHMWDEQEKFGYRFFDTPTALTQAYLQLLEKQVKPLIPQGLAVAVYTQTTDVETEINGFLTYDREVEKMDPNLLRKAHTEITQALSKK